MATLSTIQKWRAVQPILSPSIPVVFLVNYLPVTRATFTTGLISLAMPPSLLLVERYTALGLVRVISRLGWSSTTCSRW